jgi:hypothetical protein
MERSQQSLVLFIGSLEPEKLLSLANPAGRVFFPIEPREIELDVAVIEGMRPFSSLEIFFISPTWSPMPDLPCVTLVTGCHHLESCNNPGHKLLVFRYQALHRLLLAAPTSFHGLLLVLPSE